MAANVHAERTMGKEKACKLKGIAVAFEKAVKATTEEREAKVGPSGCEPKDLPRPISVASTCVPDDEEEQQEPLQYLDVANFEGEMGDLAEEYTDPKWSMGKPPQRARRFPSQAYWVHKKHQEDRQPRSGICATTHQVKDRDQNTTVQSPKIQSLWSRRARETEAHAAAPSAPCPKEAASSPTLATAAAPQKPAGPPPARQFLRPGCRGRQITRDKDTVTPTARCPAEPAAGTPPVAVAGAPQKPTGPPPARQFVRPGCPSRQQITRGKKGGLVFGAPEAGPGSMIGVSAHSRAAVAAAAAAGAAPFAAGEANGSQVSESLAGSAGLSLLLSARKRH